LASAQSESISTVRPVRSIRSVIGTVVMVVSSLLRLDYGDENNASRYKLQVFYCVALSRSCYTGNLLKRITNC